MKASFPGPGAGVAGLALALLAACSAPPTAVPRIQDAVTARGGGALSWAVSADERRARDEALAPLLAAGLTPDSAVRIAFLNSRALQGAFEEIGLAQADLWAAGFLHNPTLFASTRWPNQAPRGPDAEFSLTGGLLDDLLIPVRRRVARAAVAAAADRVAQAALDLAADVKVAAYTLEARQAALARLQAVAAANAAAGTLAQRQYDAGNISLLDLEVHQAEAGQAQVDLLRAGALARADRERLNELLGLAGAQTAWTLAAALPALPPADAIPGDLVERARAARLDLAAARARLGVARAALDLRRRTRFSPAAVNLGVDTERNPDGSRVTGPQVDVTVPLFDQGQADVARLASAARRADDEAAALGSRIEAQVRAGVAALEAARAVAQAYRDRLVPQRQQIFRDTLLNYNAMQRSTYEVLLAKEAEQRTEGEGIDALRDYWIARVELERAAGGRLDGAAPAPTP